MWTHSSIPFITVIVTLSVPVPFFFSSSFFFLNATETLASQTVPDILGFNSQVTQQFTPCYLFLFSLYLPHRFPGGDPYHCLITRTLFPRHHQELWLGACRRPYQVARSSVLEKDAALIKMPFKIHQHRGKWHSSSS